jgi:hypothetical protein
MQTLRPAPAASLVLRIAIGTAFVYAATHPGLPQLQDAATHARMIAWPIGAIGVPLVLLLARRGRPYPWRVDAALALPFALDALGNVLDLYDRWVSYDTVNHGISWFALATLVASIPALSQLPAWARAWIVAGTGALLAIAWELGEYAAFIHSSNYGRSAYPDTLTDLLAGCSGSVLAAALVLVAAHYRRVGPAAHAGLMFSARRAGAMRVYPDARGRAA